MKLFKVSRKAIILLIISGLVLSFVSGVLYTRYAAGPGTFFDTGVKLPEVKCNSIDECNVKGFEADRIIAGYPVNYYSSSYSSQQYYNKDFILIKRQNKPYNPSSISVDKFILNALIWMSLSYAGFILVKDILIRGTVKKQGSSLA